MREVMIFLMGIVSVLSLVSLSFFVAQATVLKKRAWLDELLNYGGNFAPMPFKFKAYLFLASAGFLVCVYSGYENLLWWMPNSWGSYGEDGDWTSLRSYLSGVATFLAGFGLIQLILEAISLTVENKIISMEYRLATLEKDALSKIINSNPSDAALDAYRLEFNRKLDEEMGLDLSDPEIYPGLKDFPKTRTDQHNRKIAVYKRLIETVDKALLKNASRQVDTGSYGRNPLES